MVLAISICLLISMLGTVVLGAWVVDLRWRSRAQDQELRSIGGAVERVGQDVMALHQGDRRRALAVAVTAVPTAAADSSDVGPSDSEPPSAPPRRIPPDVATLLVRSIAGGDRVPRDASPGAAVISGAQEELALVAEMLLGINTKFREAWPEPPAIGNVLTALSDRILAGLELLVHERGGAPPPAPAADDDEPPPSSDSGGGPLTH